MTTATESPHFQMHWSELGDATFAPSEAPMNYLAPKTQTYYRSKAFVSQVGINPLVAASSSLFFLVEKIKSLREAPDIEKLHADLLHEVRAFEHQAQMRNYRAAVIYAARYALCLWIDEVILNLPWGQASGWTDLQLVDTNETTQANPFFVLLNRCLQDPATHIDMLELLYLCLSFGLQGDYRHSDNGQWQLIEIRDHLFETICQQRDQFPKQLEINTDTQVVPLTFPWQALARPLLAVGTLLAIIGSYMVLDAQLAASFSTATHVPVTATTVVAV